MDQDSKLIFENYVDGLTKRKSELAGNVMDIVKYGIPSKEEFIKIRQQLHDLVNNRLKLGGKATSEEQDLFNELYGKMRAYRSQHPDDPPPSRDLSKEENAEDSAEDKMRNRENERDERQRDAEVSAPFHYDPMPGLEKTAVQIRDLLHGAANDEARTEHVIKMAQTILGSPEDYEANEYRKMLDGLIVLLNRFIVVPMN